MSRRKVRGLTRTGRQVSEDPDLDNLLSNLSPEEVEELEKEVMTVPDQDPSLDQTGAKPATVNREQRDAEPLKRYQRDLSVEGEPKRESRKQEYLRKMGLSQEKGLSASDSHDGGTQRQNSLPPKQESKVEDGGVTAQVNDDLAGPSHQLKMHTEGKGEGKAREQTDDCKNKEKKDVKENSSKTKELISKLQVKKVDIRERDRSDEIRKRESADSKTKELISRLKEKTEKEEIKERERKEEVRKREDNKTKGLMSKLQDKQNQVSETKAVEKMKEEEREKADVQPEQVETKVTENEKEVKKDIKNVEETEKESEKREQSEVNMEAPEKQDRTVKVEENKENDVVHNEASKENTKVEVGNHVMVNSKSKTKEEEEEDESASMFDEDMEKVRNNDPGMTELNVNNSEVIKIKTLIQFAEALKENTHIKTFALANCRADDHVAYALAGTLRNNKAITSINLDSNHLTSKGIMALIQALQRNSTLTELRFHNQRHICGGKTEMEMTKILKENTTLLKLGYHFELAGPRMTMTNILSRNMDRQRQRRLQEQKQAQAQGNGEKKNSLVVPKSGGSFLKGSPRASPKPSPVPSPVPSPKLTPKKGSDGPSGPPPPPPPAPPPCPMIDGDFLRNSLTPVSRRKLEDKTADKGGSREQLLASIRNSNVKQLKKVAVPKLLQ